MVVYGVYIAGLSLFLLDFEEAGAVGVPCLTLPYPFFERIEKVFMTMMMIVEEYLLSSFSPLLLFIADLLAKEWNGNRILHVGMYEQRTSAALSSLPFFTLF